MAQQLLLNRCLNLQSHSDSQVTSGVPQLHPRQLVEAFMLTVCTCLGKLLISERLREGAFSAVPALKVLC